MKICGAEISGSEVIVVTATADDAGHGWARDACTRVKLENPGDQASVKSFAQAIEAFVRLHSIDKIVVKGRLGKGQYAGGAVSFKIEAILQMLSCPVEIIMPNSIAARSKKHTLVPPNHAFAYQRAACLTVQAYLSP